MAQISFIKMDAEGFDYLVLRSIKSLLDLRQELADDLPLLFVEWFKQFQSAGCGAGGTKDLFDAIAYVGYEAYPRNAARLISQGKEVAPLTCASKWQLDLLLRPKGGRDHLG